MNNQQKNNQQALKDKVVTLVKEFINTNGGITLKNLEELFGIHPHNEVIIALYQTLKLS